MFDDLGEAVGGLALLVGAVVVCLFVGSCVQDYRKSTPKVAEVLVLDKSYYPEHTDTHCSSDSKGHMSCSSTYYPPSWSVEYADETRHVTTVSQGTYDAIRLGERKVLRYDLGGGYWQARYNERFEFGPMVAEGTWPTR